MTGSGNGNRKGTASSTLSISKKNYSSTRLVTVRASLLRSSTDPRSVHVERDAELNESV